MAKRCRNMENIVIPVGSDSGAIGGSQPYFCSLHLSSVIAFSNMPISVCGSKSTNFKIYW